MTKQIAFILPGPDEPGFFKRVRLALELQQQMQLSPTPETVVKCVEFLADFVEGDRKQAIDALWDASENQIMDLMNALAGVAEDPPFSGLTANK